MTFWMLWSIVASILIAIAAAVIERSAALVQAPRRIVWLFALAVTAIVPTALASRVPTWPTQVRTLGTALPALIAPPQRPESETPSVRLTPSPQPIQRIDQIVLGAWLIASTSLLLLFLRDVLVLRHQRSSWRPTETEHGAVLVSPNVGPAVVGFVRPQIVLPSWALSADSANRGMLFRHEREHIRAHDMLVLLGSEVARIALPWNAAIWWMTRRLRLAIELDCDARVLEAGVNAHAYGSLLLSVGERQIAPLSLASSLSDSPSNLEARINAMTTVRPRRALLSAAAYASVAFALAATTAWVPQPEPLRQGTPAPKPSRGNLAPRYPDMLRQAGVEGHTVVQFAVGSNGVPDSSTIRVVESDHDLFSASVRRALPEWHFESGGQVKLLFRFMTVNSAQLEALGKKAPPRYTDSVPAQWTVVVVTNPSS